MQIQLPEWAIGPFFKHEANPLLGPSEQGFDSWTTYNPAVAVKDGTFYMFYRAEDRAEKDTRWMGTSRIGLAVSQDGIHWKKHRDQPIIDATEEYELPGGCEDPRIVWAEGVWHLLYTGYYWPKGFCICDAVSTDLLNWEKRGPLFPKKTAEGMKSKSACPVCDPEGRAVRINGRYVLYTNHQLATSTDFIHWDVEPFEAAAFSGKPNEVCVAVTDYQNPGKDGILMLVAGNLSSIVQDGKYFYAISEALYDRNDPKRLLKHLEVPVIQAEHDYEKSVDRFPHHPTASLGTIFVDNIFRYQGKWWIYYGASDQFVALVQTQG